MLVLSIRFTDDFFIEMLERYRRQHRGRGILLAVKIVAVALLLPVAVLVFTLGHTAVAVLFALFAPSMFFAHKISYWRTRRNFLKSPFRNEAVTMELSEEGLHVKSETGDSRLIWAAFTQVTHFSDGFLLFSGPGLIRWLPTYALDGESEIRELEKLLREKIENHRVIDQAHGREPTEGPTPCLLLLSDVEFPGRTP